METMMGNSGNMDDTINVPASLDHIATVDDFLESWLRKLEISEGTIADLAIAVTELVNNAIKHGCKKDEKKKVAVSLSYRAGTVTAVVTDDGRGFDPNSIPNPIAEENLLKEIGRGIFIVRSLMDDVKFIFPPEGGTRVVIRKKIA
jgi:serine/threonine-protein kinase RsbW